MNPFLLWCVIFDSSELLYTITGVYLPFDGWFCSSAEFRCLELICYFGALDSNFKVKLGLDCISMHTACCVNVMFSAPLALAMHLN